MSQVKEQSFIARYDAQVACGALQADAGQRVGALAFELLYEQLTLPETPLKRRWLRRKHASPTQSGLYVWGDVGRGKSMLMDLLVEQIARTAPACKTRRVHFHAFMRDVHQRLFAYRSHFGERAFAAVVAEIAGESRLLCLDELQVSDVSDAMILARLFAGLMEAGLVVVFTSNRPPRELYQGGLQRDQFLKFVDLLEARMPVVGIESPQDYRLAQMRAMKQTYYYPRSLAADEFLLQCWQTLTQGATNTPQKLMVDGREIRLDKYAAGVAWMTFAELCARPLGAGDYLEICRYCHTLLLQGVPQLRREDRNEAKRFVTLIDALYDHRVKLILTAQTPPEEIYEAGDGTFEFARTVSRLMEMQSESYLALAKIA